MSDENSESAFFEKVAALEEEGTIQVELMHYRTMDEKMTFCCHVDGYFQITPNRFMQHGVGCPRCSGKIENKTIRPSEASEGDFGDKAHHYMENDVSTGYEALPERLELKFDSSRPGYLYFFRIKDEELYVAGVSNHPLMSNLPLVELQNIEQLVEVTFANGEEAEMVFQQMIGRFNEFLDGYNGKTVAVFIKDLSEDVRKMTEASVLLELV